MKFNITEQMDKSGELIFAIKGEMSINTSKELCDAMLEKMKNSEKINFDLSEVTKIDTAGLQLLLAARRESKTGKQNIILSNPNEEVSRISSLYGITL